MNQIRLALTAGGVAALIAAAACTPPPNQPAPVPLAPHRALPAKCAPGTNQSAGLAVTLVNDGESLPCDTTGVAFTETRVNLLAFFAGGDATATMSALTVICSKAQGMFGQPISSSVAVAPDGTGYVSLLCGHVDPQSYIDNRIAPLVTT